VIAGVLAAKKRQECAEAERQAEESEEDPEACLQRIAKLKRLACERQREWEIREYCTLLEMPASKYEWVRQNLATRPPAEQADYLARLIEKHDATEFAKEQERSKRQKQLEAQPHKVYGMVDVEAVIRSARAALAGEQRRQDVSLKNVRTDLEARLGLCLSSEKQRAHIKALVEKFLVEERAAQAAAAAAHGGHCVASMADAAGLCSVGHGSAAPLAAVSG